MLVNKDTSGAWVDLGVDLEGYDDMSYDNTSLQDLSSNWQHWWFKIAYLALGGHKLGSGYRISHCLCSTNFKRGGCFTSHLIIMIWSFKHGFPIGIGWGRNHLVGVGLRPNRSSSVCIPGQTKILTNHVYEKQLLFSAKDDNIYLQTIPIWQYYIDFLICYVILY